MNTLRATAEEFILSKEKLDEINKAKEIYMKEFEENVLEINKWLLNYINNEFCEEQEATKKKQEVIEKQQEVIEKGKETPRRRRNRRDRERQYRQRIRRYRKIQKKMPVEVSNNDKEKKTYADILKEK